MLFVSGFPQTLRPDELMSFMHHVIARAKRRGGCEHGCMSSCRIITTTAGVQGVERYALVEFKPARFALCCIKELHGKELAGVKIVARRYRQRSLLCERRQLMQGQEDIREQRAGDRRRDGLRVEGVESSAPRIVVALIKPFRSQPPIGVFAE